LIPKKLLYFTAKELEYATPKRFALSTIAWEIATSGNIPVPLVASMVAG
jgi:hypothetical protein